MTSAPGLGKRERRDIIREANFTCEECGIVGWEVKYGGSTYCYPTPVDRVWLSIDHIIPKSKGGTGERSNLRCICTRCNTKKGSKILPI